MKQVYTHENMALVHSAKNILEMKGIECLLKNEHGNTMGAEFGMANWMELWVIDEQQFDNAVSIIESEVTNPVEKGEWVCEKCQEKNAGSFEVCWKCQTERV